MRREIETLNDRLTAEGQTLEGGDLTKGALKTKGRTILLEILAFGAVWAGLGTPVNPIFVSNLYKPIT